MKIKSSGDAARPRRQIPLRFSHFATKGEIRRESSGGREVIAVDLRRRNFTSSGSITDIAALSLMERIDNGAPSIRHESTRSERKTRRSGRHPMISAPNGAYSKQRDETEAYGKSLITVACCLCNTSPKTAAATSSGSRSRTSPSPPTSTGRIWTRSIRARF